MKAILVAGLVWLVPLLAAAQDACGEGRTRGEAGRCCWPGQAFSVEAGRCEGVPHCPDGLLEHGDDCVAPRATSGPRSISTWDGDTVLPPAPEEATGAGILPMGYGAPSASAPTSTAGWVHLNELAAASIARRPIATVGEDEGLIAMSLVIFDVGFLSGAMVAMLDELSVACRTGTWVPTGCQSWPLAFVPVVGGLLSGLTNFGGGTRFSAGWGAGLGSVSLILQVAGIISAVISFSNQTNEYALEPLEAPLGDGTIALRLDAPGTDAGASVELRF